MHTAVDSLIVDTCVDGHHALYVRLLVQELCRSDECRTVLFYLPERLVVRVEAELAEPERGYLRQAWVPCLAGSGLKTYIALRKYVAEQRIKHVLLLYFDPFFYLQACGLGLKSSFSALWFRPTFHYSRFGLQSGSWVDYLTSLVKRLLLKRFLLPSAGLRTLFVHDDLAARYAREVYLTEKMVELVTPLGGGERSNTRLARAGHRADGRLVGLVFGSISRRKGLYEVLAALSLMNTEARQRLRLVVMGQMVESELQQLRTAVRKASRLDGVDLRIENRFVSGEEMDLAISDSDFVLLPYRRFKGSSGVLIRSALLGRPVVSCRDGLVGHEVRRYHLGRVVSAHKPAEIAQAIGQICLDGYVRGFDSDTAGEFARRNSPEQFTATLARSLADRVI